MGSPGAGDVSAVSAAEMIRLRPVAYQLESRASLDDEWRVEALDAVYGRTADDVARSLARDYATEHGRWARVSTWDLAVFLRGLLLPERPSTRLAWLQSLDDEHVPPHCQVVRSPGR